MYISPQLLRRLAIDRHTEELAHARRARLAALGREVAPGPRARLADLLVTLAARLSPAHRHLLCAPRLSMGTPQTS